MTPEAQNLLSELEGDYKKAAFYAENYTRLNLPDTAPENLSLPSDRWNSGSDHRIEIPAGSKIRLVTAQDTYKLGIGGVDTDRLMGLWVSEFSYNW